MFCTQCGCKIEKGYKFCPGCGNLLDEEVHYNEAVGQSDKNNYHSITKEKNHNKHLRLKDGFIVIGILFLCGILSLPNIILSNSERNELKKKRATEKEIAKQETITKNKADIEEKKKADDEKTNSEVNNSLPDYSTLSEEEYKNLCESYTGTQIKEMGESAEGKIVRVELMTQEDSDGMLWKCGFKNISDMGVETYVSSPCYLNDCRDDKTYQINLYDEIIVYGEIMSNKEITTWNNVYFATDIDAKYIEYAEKFGE